MVRLNALNEFTYIAIGSSSGFLIGPDSLLVLANEMHELATKINSKRYQVDAAIQQCRSYLYMRKPQEAMEGALQASMLAHETGYFYGEARAFGLVAVAYQQLGNLFQSLEYHNKFYETGSRAMAENPDQPVFGEIKSFPLKALLLDHHGQMGRIYHEMGVYPKALEHYDLALKTYMLEGDELMTAASAFNIGTVYMSMEEIDKALKYYREALPVFERFGHILFQANALANLGFCYGQQQSYDKAEEYLLRHLKIRQDQEDPMMIANAYMSLAKLEIDRKNYQKALEYTGLAEEMLDQLVEGNYGGVKYWMTVLLMYRGHVYMAQGDYERAVELFQKSYRFADEMPSLNLKANAVEYLYKVHKEAGNDRKSLAYHEELMILNDSLNKDETGKKLLQVDFSKKLLADSLLQAEDKKRVQLAHDKEILAKTNTRNILMGLGLILLIVSGGLWNRLIFMRKSRKIIEKEKERSENLLLNILPAEVAEELKQNGEAKAKGFDMVNIIFTDFKDFTQISEKLSASELVGEINYCFKGFDAIMEKYEVEKIKTIGDAYMAAGGLPTSTPESTRNSILAAIEMSEFVEKRLQEREASGKFGFEMRCGIHSGPVVAGIVGVKKFQYDIWGDTVNTASRMESSGEVGRVNISQDTYELIKGESAFSFEKRGNIAVKGKGEMTMYFVGRATP